ncbi:MAG: hypothetical protein WC570_03065 [Patescibacteria group bacterium]
MKKLFAWIGVIAILVSVVSIFTFSAQAASNYDYEISEKSPNPTLTQEEEIILWAKLKNTGTSSWFSDSSNGGDTCYTTEDGQMYCMGALVEPTRLGTIRPTDRNSGFFTYNNWISTNRAHQLDEGTVDPGETGSFGFYVTVPRDMKAGVYKECFAPVVEGMTWMADKGLCWDITVVGAPLDYYYAAQIDESNNDSYQQLVLEPGQGETITFTLLNTGSSTWERNGQYPVHLAVNYDDPGNFYNSSWLSQNRPAMLREDKVAPGQLGHFDVYVEAPSLSEGWYYGVTLSDYYWLVAEGREWFDNYDENYYYMALQVDVILVEDAAYQEEVTAMNEAWDSVDSFAYEGSIISDSSYGSDNYTIDLSGEMDQHDADNVINNMLMEMTYDYQDYYLCTSEVDGCDNSDGSMSGKLDMEIEIREQGDESYIRFKIDDLASNDLESLADLNDKWIKIDEESVRDLFESWGLDYDEYVTDTDQTDTVFDEELDRLINDTDQLILTELSGTEEIDNVMTNHYQFVMNVDQSQWMYNNYLYGEIWIGEDDHLPYRLVMSSFDNYSGYTYYDLTLKDYNQHFTFDPPSEYLTLTEVMDIIDDLMNDVMANNVFAQSLAKRIL